MTSRFLIAASLVLGANAHMFMSSPTPIQGNAVKPPLDPSGSDFPCHGVQLPTSGGEKMAAGSSQLLAFDLGGGANTAVHGGGSCQLSITYETDPVKQKDPKNWHVIYSIYGCPTTAPGNLEQAIACSNGDSTNCVNSFNYTIPQGVKDGNAILAMTWLNTIGNREMYMNCANVELTGGDGSEMSSFPSMFVANLASLGTCATTEQVNVEFPDPGKYVTTKTEGSPYKLAVPTAAGCASGSGSGNDSGAATSGYYGNGAATSSATAAPSSQATTSASSAAAAPAITSGAAPVASSTPASSAPATSGSSSGSEVTCSTPGQIVCIDSTHFGICDVDNRAVSQAVAAGTQCKDGKIMKRGVARRETPAHRRKHGHYHY